MTRSLVLSILAVGAINLAVCSNDAEARHCRRYRHRCCVTYAQPACGGYQTGYTASPCMSGCNTAVAVQGGNAVAPAYNSSNGQNTPTLSDVSPPLPPAEPPAPAPGT